MSKNDPANKVSSSWSFSSQGVSSERNTAKLGQRCPPESDTAGQIHERWAQRSAPEPGLGVV